ncbi:MAG: hypothetical protein JSR26_09510 [Proteobacteria bacterium]|nr:hypothetical protein [Pseudomonadota bacterium]
MSKLPQLTLAEKALINHTVTWVKTINDARLAGTPPAYPKPGDVDSSALFRRIRQGLAPMPWAPPTRNGQPAYELIENARGRHRVTPGSETIAGAEVVLDGARWRLLSGHAESRQYHVGFGRWPITYRLHGQDVPRWPNLPADLDEGSPHDVVRFADGRLAAKELVRRTRGEILTQWSLQCVSPLNERLYLHAERLPLDDPEHFRPRQVMRAARGVPQVFVSSLRQGDTLFFLLATDTWTRISRYLGVRMQATADLAASLERFDGGESPIDFLPRTGAWQVYEIGKDDEPWSAWRTDRREWLT